MNNFHYRDHSEDNCKELKKIVKDLQANDKEVQHIIDNTVKGLKWDQYRYHKNVEGKRAYEHKQKIKAMQEVSETLRELLFYNFGD